MLKVKGVTVCPAAIRGVINGFLPRLTGAFRIVLKVPPPRVLPPLELRVEHGKEMQEGDLPGKEHEKAQERGIEWTTKH
jgi:phenylacetate-CoA ligase